LLTSPGLDLEIVSFAAKEKMCVMVGALTPTEVMYNSLDYLRERHGLPQELLQNIAVVETLASKAGE